MNVRACQRIEADLSVSKSGVDIPPRANPLRTVDCSDLYQIIRWTVGITAMYKNQFSALFFFTSMVYWMCKVNNTYLASITRLTTTGQPVLGIYLRLYIINFTLPKKMHC